MEVNNEIPVVNDVSNESPVSNESVNESPVSNESVNESPVVVANEVVAKNESIPPPNEIPVSVVERESITKKDPRKVEQGKKLAAISKAAKERKMRLRLQQEQENSTFFFSSFLPYAGVGCITFFLGYHLLKQRDEQQLSSSPEKKVVEKKEKKSEEKKKSESPQKKKKSRFEHFG